MAVATVSTVSPFANAARIVNGRLPVASQGDTIGGADASGALDRRTDTTLSENRFLDYDSQPDEYLRAKQIVREHEDSFGGFGGVSVTHEIGDLFVTGQERIAELDLQPSDYLRGAAAYEESTERLVALREFLEAVRPRR